VVSGLDRPIGLALGAGTDLFVANTSTHQILKGSPAGGPASPFAGNGIPALAGDETPAVLASLNGAAEVAVDASGVVFIGDSGNHVIRSVTTDGVIHRVAGSGIVGFQDGPGFLARSSTIPGSPSALGRRSSSRRRQQPIRRIDPRRRSA
jgi:hypothetical protein